MDLNVIITSISTNIDLTIDKSFIVGGVVMTMSHTPPFI